MYRLALTLSCRELTQDTRYQQTEKRKKMILLQDSCY